MYKEISANNLKENLDKEPQSIVIDVRTLGELQSGVVPGAIHIDLFGPGFLEQIKVLDKDATYYIICRSGNRSDSAAGAMDHMGFKDVYNVLGGMNYWNGELQFPQREVQSKTA
jgi:rhodanese-related sulfurtransferase